MAITNLYANLPGHLVEFKDGGLQLTQDTTVATGKSLLILGTAFDGPINEPVQIDEKTVTQLFGSEVNENGYPNGATLTKYAKQAFKNGFSDVRCMRVTGSQASVDITKVSSTSTEKEAQTPVTGTILGNSAVNDIALKHKPAVPGSLVLETGTGLFVNASAFYAESGTFSLAANVVTKNTGLTATYEYYELTPATGNVDVSADDVTFDTIDLKTALGTGESIYGEVKLSVGGADLVQGTDYTIADGVVTILTTGTVQPTDTMDYEFTKATVVSTSETVDLPADTNQVVVLPVAANAVLDPASIVVSANGAVVPSSDYTVAGNSVELVAGAASYHINDGFSIAYSCDVTITYTEKITVRSIYGGSVYKDAQIAISEFTNAAGEVGRKFTFTKPESKKYSSADLPFYFTSFECPTVGVLKQALANYALNNVFEIVCDDEEIATADFPIFVGTLSEGGNDGVVVTNNEMFEALSGKRNAEGYLIEQGAYQILENYNVDYIYPAGVYADSKQTVNKHSDFHHELALLCAVLTYRTKMTHGFIDVKPNSNTTLVGIQKYVDNLLNYSNVHYMRDSEGNDIVDTEGNKMDIGWYTSIVVGPEPVMLSDTLGTYYGSPAIAYAALNASLKPQSAPTNKALPGVKGMKYKFSNKQMNELVGNRMVVFKLKSEGTTTASSTPYVVDGCTAGAPSSDYTRLSTVKVVTDVVDQIREVADPFIGEPNTIEQRNALSALISKRLSYLVEQGEIQYYEFEIDATIQQVLLGECSIALTLVCPMELRKITTVVALRAAA